MLSCSFQCKDILSRLARPVYRYERNNDAEAVHFSNMHIKIWLLEQMLMEMFLAPDFT